ncbi:hypothetical protein [Silvibacterium acidisoli]|uniref:hypothetical protein n=1 Tax=Acidobacteriaceae bacterium ZG23-2 TaxID=2883246 RepID=UPI00406C701D
MAEQSDFWKGVVTGTLVGMAIAIYAKWDLDRLGSGIPDFTEAQIGLQPDIATEPVLRRPAEVLNFTEVAARAAASNPPA